MPTAAKHPCGNAVKGCRQLTDRRLCVTCDPGGAGVHEPWAARATVTPRVRGRELQRRRARLFAREPLCRVCADEGRVTLATIRDHVIPLAEGGADDESNEQPLCQVCSDRKTEQESKRGRARFGGDR